MTRLTILAMLVLVSLAPQSGITATAEAAEHTAQQTAERDMVVARYYIGRRDYTGAINRFKIVITKFQSSEYVEEALAGLVEAYLVLGIASEASTAAAVLECKFPNGDWTAKAKALLNSAGLAPAENPASWISGTCR